MAAALPGTAEASLVATRRPLPPEAIDNETSDYCVVGLYSKNPDPRKKNRRLEVKVNRRGINLFYPTSYTLKPPANTKIRTDRDLSADLGAPAPYYLLLYRNPEPWRMQECLSRLEPPRSCVCCLRLLAPADRSSTLRR